MNKIIWEHVNYYYDQLEERFSNSEEDEPEYSEHGQEEIFDEFIDRNSRKIISSPFGMFDINDPLMPAKRTELWIGNTNFDITNEVAGIINTACGVDALRIISRYSFILGVGKAFPFKDVRREIELALDCQDANIDKLPQDIKEKIQELDDSKKNFALFVFPNGKYEITFDSDPSYSANLKTMVELKEKTGGVLIEKQYGN